MTSYGDEDEEGESEPPYVFTAAEEDLFMDLLSEYATHHSNRRKNKTAAQTYRGYVLVGKKLANFRHEHVDDVNRRFDLVSGESHADIRSLPESSANAKIAYWLKSPKSPEIADLQLKLQQDVIFMRGRW